VFGHSWGDLVKGKKPKPSRPSRSAKGDQEQTAQAASKKPATGPVKAIKPPSPDAASVKPAVSKTGPARDPSRPRFVVGIGASAGGLAAFLDFFRAMPADSGLAFVVVQHLSPNHESIMAELLAKSTTMKVVQVGDGMRVEPNHVYVIPPGRLMTIAAGVLHLNPPPERHRVWMPIDFFLRSLAEDEQEKAISIVLSGTAGDGAAGTKAVKGNGGMAMAQSPETAPFDSMPHMAIATGTVDFVLAVKEMPAAILKYVRNPHVAAEPEAAVATIPPDQLQAILALLRSRTGHDFRCYKHGTLLRRINRRMGLHQIETIGKYLKLLQSDSAEVRLLFKDLLISVTRFFRDPEAFHALDEKVIAPLVAAHETEAPIRVWAPGCATGEEPYSLAMLILERLSLAHKECAVQIFATDIDEDSLEIARGGLYPRSIVDDVSTERLNRFFILEKDGYQVSKPLRESVVFAVQNLVSHPPFSKLALISCRNLLIYLDPDVQKRVVSLFHFALQERGCLFLGSSEAVSQQEDLFEPLLKKWRIYRRIGSARPERIEFPTAVAVDGRRDVQAPVRAAPAHSPGPSALAERFLLEHYSPAAVLINRNYDALYFHGPTQLYLELPSGEPRLDLMAREGLRSRLRGAVHAAMRTRETVIVSGARVKRDTAYHAVRITVHPDPSAGAEGLLLVTFQDEPSTPVPAADEPEEHDEPLLHQLESELQATRQHLQNVTQELQASNEELKVSNEEALSMNEELQSSNEELETSKEELQSLNEELSTVNNQLQTKVEELEVSNNDRANLLSSTEIGTLFLDGDRRIKGFTPAITKLLNVIPGDIGRPVTDISLKIIDDDFFKDIAASLRKRNVVEKEVRTDAGEWYIRRVLPYRTSSNTVEGAVVTFADVTRLKQAEHDLKLLNESLEQRIEERTRHIGVLQDVAVIANESESIDRALQAALDRICVHTNWPVGHAYLPTGADHAFADAGIWSIHVPRFRKALQDVSGRFQYEPDHDLLARVIANRAPEWSSDLSGDLNLERKEQIRDLGIRAAFVVPVLVGQQVAALLEFFSTETAKPNEALFDVMAHAGTQLGRVIERRRLQEELIDAVWEQQRQFGQDLHDSIGQELTGISLIAGSLRTQLRAKSLPEAGPANELVTFIHQAQERVHRLSKGLFPVEIEAGGLMAALEELTSTVREQSKIACRFDCKRPAKVHDNMVATHLFRIAQEAINNALKHGKPQEIVVSLWSGDSHVVLSVSDNGKGIGDKADEMGGLGLRIMQYRAGLIGGSLTVQRGPLGGTILVCKI